VKNRDAKKGGLEISLFRRLSDAHPHAVVDLAYQYRMNEDIMLLSNKLIYSDNLKCGSREVAKRSLKVPDVDKSHPEHLMRHEGPCWLQRLLDRRYVTYFVN